MKNVLPTSVLSLVMVVCTHGAEVVKLEPNAILRFDFPDLPDTVATMNTAQKQPARLTAQLPENYSRDGRFPLCVYVDGWDGGRGEKPGIARAIAGSTNFICVNLPLFKRAYRTNDGFLISVEDFEIVSHAYARMLSKLVDTVPNITVEHSAFGGFSNGAHTTALLLAGGDQFMLDHFQEFYIVEGGAFLAGNALHRQSLKHCRFLFLHGDYAGSDPEPAAQGFLLLGRAIEHYAKSQKLDFTSVVMQNTGHDFPPKYMALAGQWIRGEKLTDTKQPQ